MNDINKLIVIIESLGGKATFSDICDSYQKENRIVLSPNHKITLARTLKDYPDLVHFDNDTNSWILKAGNEVKTADKGINSIAVNSTSITEVVDILKRTGEMIPEKYDGSYVWMKAAIDEYSKLSDFSAVDVNDMDFIYSLAIRTWKMAVNIKKDRLDKTNLGTEAKDRLNKVIEAVWDNAVNKIYFHHSSITSNYRPFLTDQRNLPEVGMFGTGFMTFKNKLDDSDARSFIKMMVDIKDIDDSEQLYNVCEKTLNKDYVGRGLKAAAASAILHCYKPFSFPILNSNEGKGTIYSLLEIQLDKSKTLHSYITNCRHIKEYRDREFKFKNYRILDISMWAIGNKNGFDLASYLDGVTEKLS
ncbi:MAG: hypothetical protein ACI32B_01590 [Erysipelotrichaceae bacterium]